MARPIKSILLLIMIFVAASGIPLYADTLSINFDLDFTKPFSSSQENSITVDTSITMLSPSHPQLQIALGVDENQIPLQFKSENPIELSLYFQEALVGNMNIEEININDGLSTSFYVDIPQSEFDVPNGSYELEVKLNLDAIEDPIISNRISIYYHTEATYMEALESINRDQSALTLYFPDNSSNHLIPVTRVIPFTRTPLRYTIEHLIQGPKDALGLPLGSPIPDIQGLSLNRSIANVYLPGDIGAYEQYATSARVAVDSIVYSLSTINEVQGVQFYFDNEIRDFAFHEMIVDEPIYPSESPKYYVGYISSTNRILLTPVTMNTANPAIASIFDGLKYSGQQISYNYNLQPTVPEEVILLDYTIVDNNLTLKLNEAFVTAYTDYPDSRKMMIDSLVYTFTSLDNIESVEFQVEGLSSIIAEDTILNHPLVPSSFVNPE
ncbi:Sporulation and spore germination [Natronincola peptidivorans]|uniref:Sporulation and spore germination n=1 Tax=Natronincola peptidivorans TaxID=426128 RepID=A0A1I0EME0_9FIRM|nr:GerMN domain-containing protein [Natronincola peptidivorans]SET46632.1 Sporulation and spore germination [Natronincola peptidivorans]